MESRSDEKSQSDITNVESQTGDFSERQRIETLAKYMLLNTEAENVYDEIVHLAAQICDCPISLITLVDNQRQWFKARVGLKISETPRDQAFCAHTILNDNGMIVGDALEDERFKNNPLVIKDPNIRFYAGFPLKVGNGKNLGTLCVIDRVPREIEEGKLDALRILSRQIVANFELRRTAGELAQMTRRAAELEKLVRRYCSRDVWTLAGKAIDEDSGVILPQKVAKVFVFIDCSGFTELAENRRPMEVASMLEHYLDPIIGHVHEHGGDVEKFIGDCVFCVFPDAETSVAAILAIGRTVASLNRDREESAEKQMRFKIGAHFGTAIRVNIGAADRKDMTFIGDAVNIAARLQENCTPDQALISEAVLQECSLKLDIVESRVFGVKGRDKPLTCHAIRISV